MNKKGSRYRRLMEVRSRNAWMKIYKTKKGTISFFDPFEYRLINDMGFIEFYKSWRLIKKLMGPNILQMISVKEHKDGYEKFQISPIRNVEWEIK